jgi:hypothetical protein
MEITAVVGLVSFIGVLAIWVVLPTRVPAKR